uniref:Putative transposase n=1 Tax=Tuber indicum TaxID=55307 RepID=W0CA66_9PEZI|nr:putative transposase [Tuber indicum]
MGKGKGKAKESGGESLSAAEKIRNLPPPPHHIPFQGLFPPHQARAIGPATGVTDPYRLFSLFFSPEQLEILARHTNIYASMHDAGLQDSRHPLVRKWYPTTPSELRILLAILIHLGISRGASPKLFWRKVGGVVPEPMCRMRYIRFQQLKRYLHISEPSESPIPTQKFEKPQKECFLPSTNVAVDEMMIRFLGRSAHTIKMPNKPISLGYKVLALCDAGYTYDWELTSRIASFATSEQQKMPYPLSPTSSAVLQMLTTLPYRTHFFTAYMDNYFSNIRLFARLLDYGIGACGTVRCSSKDFPPSLNISKDKAAGILKWNFATGVVVREIDNNTVHLLSTVHDLEPSTSWIKKLRRRPRETSTNAAAARKPFSAGEHRKLLAIPKIDNDYNQFMGSVDIADQLRSYFSTQRIVRRNWQPFFYWLLDTAIINAYRIARTNGSKTTHRTFRSSLTSSLLTAGQKHSSPEPKFTFLYRTRRRYRLRNPVRQIYITKNSQKPEPVGGGGTLRGHVLVRKATRAWCLWCRWRHKQGGSEVKIHQVRSQCERCHVALCHSCFPLYHGVGSSLV